MSPRFFSHTILFFRTESELLWTARKIITFNFSVAFDSDECGRAINIANSPLDYIFSYLNLFVCFFFIFNWATKYFPPEFNRVNFFLKIFFFDWAENLNRKDPYQWCWFGLAPYQSNLILIIPQINYYKWIRNRLLTRAAEIRAKENSINISELSYVSGNGFV